MLCRDETYSGPVAGSYPLVFDLRDGVLVEAVTEDPELLVRGESVVPGSETKYYDMVHVQRVLDRGRHPALQPLGRRLRRAAT